MLLEPLYQEIRHKILDSVIVHFDETGYPVDGRSAWVWIARTVNEAFHALEYSRGANVLKKYWKKFKGIVISDGWMAYVNMFFPTRDSDALHICKEILKMYHINQKTN